MQKVECKMCSYHKFHCPTGKHENTPGRIHSGVGAVSDSQWDCPNCGGRGFIPFSFVDRLLLRLYIRAKRLHVKVHPF